MLLNLSTKSFTMKTTVIAIILLHLLTIILPISSSPLRPSSSPSPSVAHDASSPSSSNGASASRHLNQLLDPVYQSEQDNQLESKRVVPKSVYNTVIRVTTTPCSAGSQRFKEGGPCVTRYTGSGPVLDEEFQLSILKGITSLGGVGGGGRRTSQNRNRNRHRTSSTTTPMPETTMEPELDEEPLPTESSQPSEFEDIKKIGNVEILDIEVDSLTPSDNQRPELSPTAPASLSVVTSQPMTVSIPAPQPGPRPTSTLTSTPHQNSGSNTQNVEPETKLAEIVNPILLSPTLPIAGIKDDEGDEREKTTIESIIDFSTTMMPIKGEDSVINVSFPPDQEELDVRSTTASTTEVPLVDSTSSSAVTMPGQNQNVMVNQDEDKAIITNQGMGNNNISNIDLIQDPDPVNFPESKQPNEESKIVRIQLSENTSQTHFFPTERRNPMGSSTSSGLEHTPVTLIIPLVPQHLPASMPSSTVSTSTTTTISKQGKENQVRAVVMTDRNTRLDAAADLNGDTQEPTQDTKSDSIFPSTTTSSPSPSSHHTSNGRLIQINDFEIDPITTQELQPSLPSAIKMMDGDDDVEEQSQEQNQDAKKPLTNPNLEETFSNPTSPPSPSETPITSLAQEILSKLRPISQLPALSSPSTWSSHSEEVPFSPISPTHQTRWRFPTEVTLDEIESDLRSGSDSGHNGPSPFPSQAEIDIDQSHHRSRSRNRVKNLEISSPSSMSSSSLILPSHHHPSSSSSSSTERDQWRWDSSSGGRSLTSREKVDGGGESFAETPPSSGFGFRSFAPSGPLDYMRLGDNYRRFRVF